MLKTSNQIQFADFLAELEKRGYNRAAIAKVSKISQPMISQILSGKKSPGDPSLELLRREVHREHGGVDLEVEIAVSETTRRDVQQKLDELAQRDPKSFESVKLLTEALHHRIERARKANSTATGEQAKAVALAAQLADSELQESRRKRAVGAPNARKPSPSPSVSQDSKAQPAPPKRAQGGPEPET